MKSTIPTLRDVAKRAGVSQATASFALRKHPKAKSFSSETLQMVYLAAKDLNYRTNFFSSQLRRTNSQLVMVYIETLQDLYSSALAESFQQRAAERGYWTMIHISPLGQRGKLFDEKVIGRHGISAVVVLSAVADRLTQQNLRQLARDGVRVIVVGRELESEGVSQVLVDDYRGAWMAAKHIYELGARRVWLMRGTVLNKPPRRKRYQAVLDYAAQNNLPKPITLEIPLHVDDSSIETPAGIGQDAYHVLRDRLKDESPPDAIITSLDLRALNVYRAIYEAGYQPGRDIAVIGYDDIWPAQMTYPALTSIHQPTAEMGQIAADILIDGMEDRIRPGRRTTLEPELIIRDSTRLWTPKKR